MNTRQRNFLLLVTLVSAATTPVVSQPKDSAAVPDLSGIWTHSIPGFEPMASGPTALINTQRRENGTGNILKLAGDHTNPILKPEAVEIVKMHAERGLSWTGDPNPRNQCRPEGVPFLLTGRPTSLLQQKDKVTILYGHDHQSRQVRLNQPHPAQVTPSWYGDSVGHYEGDTLVVDTIGLDTRTYVDNYFTPHSERLRVVERIRMIEGGRTLEVKVHVEDPGAFTTPWNAVQLYRRMDNGPMVETVCAENNDDHFNHNVGPVPTADKPDF
jgi:hypothetical protein